MAEIPEVHDTVSWAEREVKLLIERERKFAEKDGDSDGFNYISSCAESALNAFKVLENFGHSGLSMSITHSILDNLINCKPLTPIEDDESQWSFSFINDSGEHVYQNLRYSALFKMVSNKDGETVVRYGDNDKFICKSSDNENMCFHSGFISRIVEESGLVPKIEFPYLPPSKPYVVIVEDLLTDYKNGDFDTIRICKVTGNGVDAEFGKCYAMDTIPPHEITNEEWLERKIIAARLKENFDKVCEEIRNERPQLSEGSIYQMAMRIVRGTPENDGCSCGCCDEGCDCGCDGGC